MSNEQWGNRFLRAYHLAVKLKIPKPTIEKHRKAAAKESLKTGEPFIDVLRTINMVIYDIPNANN